MYIVYYFCVFFFSSRRRHTRCSRDWSSDVCSSDLHACVRQRELQAPDLSKPRIFPVLGLPSAEPVDNGHDGARHELVGAELPDQPGGLRRVARGELSALEHQHVGDAGTRQMVGDGASPDSAPDDDDPGCLTHRLACPLIVRLIRQAIAEKSTSRIPRNTSHARGISGNAPSRTDSQTAATSPSPETATIAWSRGRILISRKTVRRAPTVSA